MTLRPSFQKISPTKKSVRSERIIFGSILAICASIFHSLIAILFAALACYGAYKTVIGDASLDTCAKSSMIICGVAALVSYGATAHFNFKSLFDRDISVKPQDLKTTWPLIAVPFADVLIFACYVLNSPDMSPSFTLGFVCSSIPVFAGIFFVYWMTYNIFAEDSATTESCLMFLKPYAPVKRSRRDPLYFNQI